jgi:hypothetical protein
MKQFKEFPAVTILCEACHWRTAHQQTFKLSVDIKFVVLQNWEVGTAVALFKICLYMPQVVPHSFGCIRE